MFKIEDDNEMKKVFSALVLFVFLSGCSWLGWSEPKVETQAPNNFLWLAAKEKLAFMPILQESEAEGFILTDWSSIGNVKDEQFKFGVSITSHELKTDSFKVEVYKRIKDGNEWIDRNPDNRIALRIQKAILLRARQLYRENFMREKGYN